MRPSIQTHHPHALDIFAGKAPIAPGIEIADVQHLVMIKRNAGKPKRDPVVTRSRPLKGLS